MPNSGPVGNVLAEHVAVAAFGDFDVLDPRTMVDSAKVQHLPLRIVPYRARRLHLPAGKSPAEAACGNT